MIWGRGALAQRLTRAYTDDLSVAAGDEELVDSHDVVDGGADIRAFGNAIDGHVALINQRHREADGIGQSGLSFDIVVANHGVGSALDNLPTAKAAFDARKK